MLSRCCEFVDSRLRRSPPDRASAVPYGQAGENAMRFPHLAYRSAAAHKLHSATASQYEFDSGKGETFSRPPALAYSSPEAVQTTGTVAVPLYNRCETSTQTRADAQKQVTSMEVWGAPARGSNIPSVKAYRSAMVPPRPRGIEFCSPVSPTPGRGTPFEARWYLGTPGVSSRQGSTFAAITISYIKNTQVP
jgi:hypothetical protein